jgi:hypothetical protein
LCNIFGRSASTTSTDRGRSSGHDRCPVTLLVVVPAEGDRAGRELLSRARFGLPGAFCVAATKSHGCCLSLPVRTMGIDHDGGARGKAMDEERDELVELMGAMAAGDSAALFVFLDVFGGRLAASVRRHLNAFGRRDVAGDLEQMAFLVMSAALAIFDRAASWSPDGALPWTWADLAIRSDVVAYLGHPSVELDEAVLTTSTERSNAAGALLCRPIAVVPDRCIIVIADDDLDALVARDERVALLRDAIARCGKERDQRVHIQYRIQKRTGDASPAHTVAAEFGLMPANVRQNDLRMRRRLQRLIEVDAHFAPLRDLEWLQA